MNNKLKLAGIVLALFAVGAFMAKFTVGDTFDPDKVRTEAKAAAVMVLVSSVDLIDQGDSGGPDEPPGPPGEVCSNCDGTGRVGDGNGASSVCPVCNGSGKGSLPPQASTKCPCGGDCKCDPCDCEGCDCKAAKEVNPWAGYVLYYQGASWCPPCQNFKNQAYQRLKDEGLQIKEARISVKGKPVESYPAFFLQKDGKTVIFAANPNQPKNYYWTGYTSYAKFKQKLNRAVQTSRVD